MVINKDNRAGNGRDGDGEKKTEERMASDGMAWKVIECRDNGFVGSPAYTPLEEVA